MWLDDTVLLKQYNTVVLCIYIYQKYCTLHTIQLHPSLVTGAIQIQLPVKTLRLAQGGGGARRVMH